MKPKITPNKLKLAAISVSVFLAIVLLFLPVLPQKEMATPLLFVGRFHPLVLHFPIVLIILALVLELLDRFKLIQKHHTTVTLILIAASASCVFVVAAGYFLYASGEYSGDLISQHFQAGVLAGAGILLTTASYFAHQLFAGIFQKLYLGLLIVTNGFVGYTSHIGGSITHGQDYLTEYMPSFSVMNDRTQKPLDSMLVYEDIVHPFLTTKCMSCHNEHKKKGDYLMTSYGAMVNGGESGKPAIVKNKADQSELYVRVTLPADHEDKMPPEGKRQLSNQEVEILKLWIDAGASTDLKVVHTKNNPELSKVLNNYAPEAIKMGRQILRSKEESKKLQGELQALANKLQVKIAKDTNTEGDFYGLSMTFPPATFSTLQLQELLPYFPYFSKMSLVASDIGDDDLFLIGKMENLQELYLQKTDISGQGLIYLQGLEHLETLNLSFTKIDNAAILSLIKFPSIKKVYLFGNQLDKEVVSALHQSMNGGQVLMEEGPYN